MGYCEDSSAERADTGGEIFLGYDPVVLSLCDDGELWVRKAQQVRCVLGANSLKRVLGDSALFRDTIGTREECVTSGPHDFVSYMLQSAQRMPKDRRPLDSEGASGK